MTFPFGRPEPKQIMEVWDVLYVNTSGTKSGISGTSSASMAGGMVGNVIIGGGTMGAFTITDNTAASGGTTLFHIATPSGNTQYWINTPFSRGLTVFASAATIATVYYHRSY